MYISPRGAASARGAQPARVGRAVQPRRQED